MMELVECNICTPVSLNFIPNTKWLDEEMFGYAPLYPFRKAGIPWNIVFQSIVLLETNEQ
jgi:hypothetical protein